MSSDPYHNEPFKALQDWTDHLDRMAALNKIFPGDHPAYYEPKRPLPLPDRRAKSLPPVKSGHNYAGKTFNGALTRVPYEVDVSSRIFLSVVVRIAAVVLYEQQRFSSRSFGSPYSVRHVDVPLQLPTHDPLRPTVLFRRLRV